MASPEDISDDYISEALRAEIAKNFPELLETFEKECSYLVEEAKKRIKRVLAFDNNADVGNLIKASVEKWEKERGMELMYREYCELMEKQGLKPLKPNKFNDPKRPTASAPYQSFIRLKEKEITVGDKVKERTKENGKIYTVWEISRICRVTLTDERGNNPQTLVSLDGYRKVT